jgi:cell wall-associated NlpC family hydrolase
MRTSKSFKLIVFILVFAVFITSASFVAFAETSGTVTGSVVNVRAAASTSSDVVTTAEKGETVTIISQTGDWYQITKGNFVGYIHKDYLKASEPVEKIYVVTGAEVRVRAAASTSSDIVANFTKGTTVTVTGESGDWLQIKKDNITGYMHKDYLAPATATTPVVEEKPTAPVDLGTGIVTASTLNLRKTPNGDVISKLSKGTVLKVFSIESNWYKCEYNGTVGYCSSEYIQLNRDSGTSRGSSDSNFVANIISFAKKFLGVKYKYGGASPSGFDCSGFTYYVFKNNGVTLPRGATAQSQSSKGFKISRNQLQPGDLVFFKSPAYKSAIGHVGIYLGNGNFIHSSSPGDVVKIDTLTSGYYDNHYVTARRIS